MSVENGRAQPPSRPLRARARLRPKSQLTLPEEIRHALQVGVGDELEFAVQDDGTITVRGYVSIPSDQLWRYTPRQDEGPSAGR
jgi:bifunctional DNA-binding transcriptional regulator/antitoxin component of YhaV-PrlF toxin-antitoxin module